MKAVSHSWTLPVKAAQDPSSRSGKADLHSPPPHPSNRKKTQMKKIITLVIAALAVTIAAPAQAAAPAGKKEENYLLSIGKMAWLEMGSDTDIFCDLYSISRTATINEMTDAMMEASDYEYRRTDARRAATRLLKWGC